MTNPSYTAAYTYAADGLRLRVQESNNPNPDRWMQYDGVRPVLEETLDSQGVFTTLNKYVWEGNGYYDPLLYSLISGAWRYHLYDGLGSTRQLLQHLSPYNVTDTYQYEAFGNVLSSTGTTPNPYQYVGSLGYYKSGDPHLLLLGARYYMPEVGRFLNGDPITRSANRYTYADPNPLLSADPSGLSPWWGRILPEPPKVFPLDRKGLRRCLRQAENAYKRGIVACDDRYKACLQAAACQSGYNDPLWPVNSPGAPLAYAAASMQCWVEYQACLVGVELRYDAAVADCYWDYLGMDFVANPGDVPPVVL